MILGIETPQPQDTYLCSEYYVFGYWLIFEFNSCVNFGESDIFNFYHLVESCFFNHDKMKSCGSILGGRVETLYLHFIMFSSFTIERAVLLFYLGLAN